MRCTMMALAVLVMSGCATPDPGVFGELGGESIDWTDASSCGEIVSDGGDVTDTLALSSDDRETRIDVQQFTPEERGLDEDEQLTLEVTVVIADSTYRDEDRSTTLRIRKASGDRIVGRVEGTVTDGAQQLSYDLDFNVPACD